MKQLQLFSILVVLAGTAACSSDDNAGGDAGPDASAVIQPEQPGGNQQLYGLSGNDNCYQITSIAPGASDGCNLGVADLAEQMISLPVNYDGNTGTVTAGTDGSLGSGFVRNNEGTLLRDNNPTDPRMPGCTWHQTNTSKITLTANDVFTISVTEAEEDFAPGCADIPSGGACVSTWTWNMQKSNATPPECM